MSLIGLLILVVIAAIAGSLGQAIAGYSRGGCLLAAVVGFIGAFLGSWLGRQLGLPEILPVTVDGETFPVMWAVIGSTLFSAVLGLLARGRVRTI
ncbi:MAG: GlsB/YeaQ/YmgE family stress response membrane protein [Candidatus Promineifilaceae bacterium]